jgi:hypothetical protein
MSTSPLGNGPFNGYSPKQTITNYKDSEQTTVRTILRRSWNNTQAVGTINGKNRIITPFRAVNNLGDFLARQNYVCGGANQTHGDKPGWNSRIRGIMSNCDGSGVPAGAGNQRFVSDTSDYTTFKKQRAIVKTYNDKSFGGDDHHASFVPLMIARLR